MKKLIMGLALMVVITLVFTACGKKEGAAAPKGTAEGNAKEITIHAKNFEFDQKEIRVNKGDTVKITLDNTQGVIRSKLTATTKRFREEKP